MRLPFSVSTEFFVIARRTLSLPFFVIARSVARHDVAIHRRGTANSESTDRCGVTGSTHLIDIFAFSV